MAIYWKCKNKDCKQFGKEVLAVSYRMGYNKEMKLVPIEIPPCPECGEEFDYREVLPEQKGDININYSSFNSKSNEEKASVLKKRYKDGIKNTIDETIREKRNQVTKSFFKEV